MPNPGAARSPALGDTLSAMAGGGGGQRGGGHGQMRRQRGEESQEAPSLEGVGRRGDSQARIRLGESWKGIWALRAEVRGWKKACGGAPSQASPPPPPLWPVQTLRSRLLSSGGWVPFLPEGAPHHDTAPSPRVPSRHQRGHTGSTFRVGWEAQRGKGPGQSQAVSEAIPPTPEAPHHVPERPGQTRRDTAVTRREGSAHRSSASAWGGRASGNRSRVGRVGFSDGQSQLPPPERGPRGPARGLRAGQPGGRRPRTP